MNPSQTDDLTRFLGLKMLHGNGYHDISPRLPALVRELQGTPLGAIAEIPYRYYAETKRCMMGFPELPDWLSVLKGYQPADLTAASLDIWFKNAGEKHSAAKEVIGFLSHFPAGVVSKHLGRDVVGAAI